MHADADLSPRGIARLLAGFLADLGLDDVTLVGNDTGGALCQFLIDVLLDTDPGRVGRLVLTDCDAFEAFPPFPLNLLVRALRRPRVVRALEPLMRIAAVRRGPLGFGPLARAPLDDAMTAAWSRPLREAAIRRDLTRVAQAVRPADLLDVSTRLGGFDRPVRLLWGEDDRFFRPALGRRLAALFPDAVLTTVPGARTFVPLDAPEQLADVITGP